MTVSAENRAKQAAACRAVDFVEDGMRVGLGTGSTAAFMVRRLGEVAHEQALTLTCVATSSRTSALAEDAGLTVRSLNDVSRLDLTIDGTDECDAQFNLIKGGGGALLHEKIVASASDRMVVIAERTKLVETLGAFPLPIEVIPFGWKSTQAQIVDLLAGAAVAGREISLRGGAATPFRTDEGNLILDLHLQRIADPVRLAAQLNLIPGIVENGFFLDICDTLVIGEPDGTTEIRESGTGHARQTRHEAAASEGLLAKRPR